MLNKLRNKKNNKGFSLVELIVVILIMAIIAVALAPQVMKWVTNSKITADQNAAGNLKTAVQIAIADFETKGGSIAAACTYTIAGPAVTPPAGEPVIGTIKLSDLINANLGKENYSVKYTDGVTDIFNINISIDKLVTVYGGGAGELNGSSNVVPVELK